MLVYLGEGVGVGGGGGGGGPSTCPGDNAMRGLTLLLVLFLVQRALFPGIRSCPLLNNEHIQIQIEQGRVRLNLRCIFESNTASSMRLEDRLQYRRYVLNSGEDEWTLLKESLISLRCICFKFLLTFFSTAPQVFFDVSLATRTRWQRLLGNRINYTTTHIRSKNDLRDL